MEQRLQKILAAAGVGSRRHCETLITGGRVAVDGKIVRELGVKADPDVNKITFDGLPIKLVEDKIYLLLNKPVGYTSTRSDPHALHTVMELVRGLNAYLYPVGRLDVDTSGLLILTNDGDFTKLLTHPSHEVDKTYVAVVEGRISASHLTRLERGVKLEDGSTSPAKARLIGFSSGDNTSSVELIIHEGRKRQVRRMFEVMGYPVVRLSRVKLGNLDLRGVQEGQFRRLTKREVSELTKLAMPKSAIKARGVSRTTGSDKSSSPSRPSGADRPSGPSRYGSPDRPGGSGRSNGPGSRPSGQGRPSAPGSYGGPDRPSGPSRYGSPDRPGGSGRSNGPSSRPSGAGRYGGPDKPSGPSRPSGTDRPSGSGRPRGSGRPNGPSRPSGPGRPGGPRQTRRD